MLSHINIGCGKDITIVKLVRFIEGSLEGVAILSLLDDVKSRDFNLSLSNKKLLKKFPSVADFDLLREVGLFVKSIY